MGLRTPTHLPCAIIRLVFTPSVVQTDVLILGPGCTVTDSKKNNNRLVRRLLTYCNLTHCLDTFAFSSPHEAPRTECFFMMQVSSNRDASHREQRSSDTPSFPGPRSLAAGAAGGICSVLMGHPFDLVKVRLQTADGAIRRKAMDVFKSNITRERGIRVCQSSLIRSRLFLMEAGYLRRRLRTLNGRDTNLYLAFLIVPINKS